MADFKVIVKSVKWSNGKRVWKVDASGKTNNGVVWCQTSFWSTWEAAMDVANKQRDLSRPDLVSVGP